MKIFLLIIFQFLFVGHLCAQNDTVRWYQQTDKSVRRISNNPALELFPVHDRKELVIVEEFDSEKRLLKRATTIDEKCYAGPYFEFDANTQIEVVGNYLRCGLKDGFWCHVTTDGDTLAKEYWSGGQFIKEVIEQKYNAIWSYKLMLNEREFTNGDGINLKHNFRLAITLFFKNDLAIGRPHVIKCTILRGSKLIDEKGFSSDTDFNRFDHYSWCKRSKLRSGDRITLVIYQSPQNDKLVGYHNMLIE
jgi:hypothetical protein